MHKLLIILSAFFLACTTTEPVIPPKPAPLKKVWQVKNCETNAVLWTDVFLFVNRAGNGQQILINDEIYVHTGKTAKLGAGAFFDGEAKYKFGCPDVVIVEPEEPQEPEYDYKPLLFVLKKVDGKYRYIYRAPGSKIISGTNIAFGYKPGNKNCGKVDAYTSPSTEFYNIPTIDDPYNLTSEDYKGLGHSGTIKIHKLHDLVFKSTWCGDKEYKVTLINLKE